MYVSKSNFDRYPGTQKSKSPEYATFILGLRTNIIGFCMLAGSGTT